VAPEPAASVATGSPGVLRALRESDVGAIASWHAKAILLAGSSISLSDLVDPSERLLVLTEEADREPVGLLSVALDNPEPGWATVVLLAIAAPECRDLAVQAVALLEADLRQEARHIRAAAPLDVGLALYFWLRLGYRPTVSGERLWMTRELDP
jgi:hypothetical protein